MSILLLGGMGKTGSRLARYLQKEGKTVVVASRSGTAPAPYQGCRFDWTDRETYRNPFNTVKENDSNSNAIAAVYLCTPALDNMAENMHAFIDVALAEGVRRFVLMSASVIEPGGPAMGEVHKYLMELPDIEWAVLRPTWFMENFSEQQHLATIKSEDKIYSATDKGQVPWICAEDIASVASRIFLEEQLPNKDYIILGPELLSYDEIAELFTNALGRRITHVNLTEDQLVERHMANGLPKTFAHMLAQLDRKFAKGSEAYLNNVVQDVTGKEPIRFKDFIEANKACWVRSS